MNYAIIIKYLLNNIYYNKYINIININNIKYNNKYIYKILLSLKELKEKHPKEEHTPQELETMLYACYPALQGDEAEACRQVLQQVTTVTVDPALADDLFSSLATQAQAEAIAERAIEVSQGKAKFESLAELFKMPEIVTPDDTFAITDLEAIYNHENAVPGLRWRLQTLNKILGPLRVGDFGFLFGRPEIGKTTLLASEVTFLGTQTEQPVLWVNNEQRGTAVIPRCYSALLGLPESEIRKDVGEARNQWQRTFGDRFKFVDNPSITASAIDRICADIKPGLIVFDQLDKVHGFEADRHDLLMKKIYQWARELAKMYGPCIGVCQAGGTAEGKKYLDMNDVDSSHTAKQGEADWIIGLGKSNDDGFERVRYLSICKNKLPESDETVPELRHGKVEVFIDEPTARYVDKIRW